MTFEQRSDSRFWSCLLISHLSVWPPKPCAFDWTLNTSKVSRVFPTATNVDSRPDFRVYRTPWKLSRSVDALPFLSQSSSSFPYSRNRVCTLPAAVCVHSYVFLRQMQHRLFRSEITQNLRLLLMLYTARACFPLAMLSTFRHTYLCCILSVCVHIDNC